MIGSIEDVRFDLMGYDAAVEPYGGKRAKPPGGLPQHRPGF